ncbi:lysozyme inhibitor LprI family protein [Pseudomonas sp. Ma2-10]
MPFALPHPILIHTMMLASMAFTTIAAANSFDCANAATPTEKAICSDPYTLGLDRKLGKAWKTAKATVKDTVMLKADQRQWIKNRDHCAADFHCLRRSY